jgi:hypothetical protein
MAEVAIILAIGSGKSPVPVAQQANAIGKALARSDFVPEVLGHRLDEADASDVERRLSQWAHRVLLDWRSRKGRRRKSSS